MTTVTITIEDFFGNGGDSNSLFLSSAPYRIEEANISGSGGSGKLVFSRYSGGAPDPVSPYTLTAFGNDFAFAPGVSDISGDVTSLTMQRRFGNGPVELLASASFALDGQWATKGGVTISSLESMTVDTLVGRVLQGSSATLVLVGGRGNDTLHGSFWHDTLRGGAGGDTLLGGDGFDTASYEGSEAGVTVNLATRAASGGDALGDVLVSIESVTGSDQADTLTGDGANNTLNGLGGKDTIRGGGGNDFIFGGAGGGTFYGDAGNDRVDGGGDADTLYGGIGDDDLRVGNGGGNYAYGEAGEDELSGGDGADRLYGGADADTLTGFGGADILDGGAGADYMYGGQGTAYFYVDTALDIASDDRSGDGDRVLTTVSYVLRVGSQIELYTTTNSALTTALNMTGNEFAQTILGNAGANIIDGKGGADTMQGGLGDDIYYVDSFYDVVLEAANSGFDRVMASVSYTLAAGRQIERLMTTNTAGTDTIQLHGNEFAQLIQGNDGENTLNGKGGADTMYGYGGNDRYIVENVGDKVIEAAGAGVDALETAVSYTLAAGVSIESMYTGTGVDGTTAINLTGNEFEQDILGNSGNNIMNGGLGDDILNGWLGRDTFRFNTSIDGGNVDTIVEYSVADDAIQLENAIFSQIVGTGALTTNQFRANAGAVALDGDDRILYDTTNGNLWYDTNGVTAGGRTLFATLDTAPSLVFSEFVVI